MKILYLLLPIFLISCAPQYTQQTIKHFDNVIQTELQAWKLVQEQYNRECKSTAEDGVVKPDDALEVNQCYEELANKLVMPVAISPSNMSEFLLANKKSALAYKQGKIDRDELNIAINENWITYSKSIDAVANAAIKQASQADTQLAQQRQQYFQNLSQQIQKQEAMTQQANDLQTTNCRVIGHTLNCHTW